MSRRRLFWHIHDIVFLRLSLKSLQTKLIRIGRVLNYPFRPPSTHSLSFLFLLLLLLRIFSSYSTASIYSCSSRPSATPSSRLLIFSSCSSCNSNSCSISLLHFLLNSFIHPFKILLIVSSCISSSSSSF